MLPTLNYTRRHGRKCSAKRPVGKLTFEGEERRKGFARCDCPIFASGTLDGIFRRIGTQQTAWDEAAHTMQPFLDRNSWTMPGDSPATPPPPPPPAPGSAEKPGVTVEQAIKECLDGLKADETAEGTLKKYRSVLRGRAGLQEFATANGIRFISDCDPRSMRLMSQGWKVSPVTRRTKMSVVKPFFEQLVEDGVITANPARIRLRRNRALVAGGENEDHQARLPFTDAELKRMLDGCKIYGANQNLREWPKKKDGRQVVAISEYRDYNRKFDGKDVADFIELSYKTGLRFMDVAKFHISRLNEDGEVKLRARKNGNWVCVWIPDYVRQMIQERARKFGPYIFGDPAGRKDHDVYLCWYRRLNQLWKETGPYQAAPTHHRFRHTFIRILLQNGTPVSIVAQLVGDAEETIRKHYSNWVTELQEANRAAMQKAERSAQRLRS